MEDLVSLLTNHHLFSKASGPFYKPTSNIWGFQFLHVIISGSSSSNENGVKFHCGFNLWFLQWLLMLSIFSPAYWPFAYFLWRNTYSNILPFLKLLTLLILALKIPGNASSEKKWHWIIIKSWHESNSQGRNVYKVKMILQSTTKQDVVAVNRQKVSYF